MRKIDATGETNYNTYNRRMTIIEYKCRNDIVVEFENGYITKTDYRNFMKGFVKCPYDKTLLEIGYLGEGKYKTRNGNKKTRCYETWHDMLKRCYDEKSLEKHPTYKGCSVCNEWHNFQNFAEWYNDNYYEIEGEKMNLDKDILVKGNRIYSPETCIFASNRINTLFLKQQNKRGEYPLGVSLNKKSIKSEKAKKFIATCNNITIGVYNTSEQAFNTYKEFKEDYIKQVANEYKEIIPEKLYKAMLNWKIEIID